MKYQESVYSDFSSFLAEATQIAKDKINLYNSFIDPPTRKKLQDNAFQRFLVFLMFILKKFGWFIYIAIAGLLGLGLLGFFGGMGSLIAANPVLAAGVALAAGGGVYLIWEHKDVYLAHEKIGKRYKIDFEIIADKYSKLSERSSHVESLLKRCVKSICIEVFTISSDEFFNKGTEEGCW